MGRRLWQVSLTWKDSERHPGQLHRSGLRCSVVGFTSTSRASYVQLARIGLHRSVSQNAVWGESRRRYIHGLRLFGCRSEFFPDNRIRQSHSRERHIYGGKRDLAYMAAGSELLSDYAYPEHFRPYKPLARQSRDRLGLPKSKIGPRSFLLEAEALDRAETGTSPCAFRPDYIADPIPARHRDSHSSVEERRIYEIAEFLLR
jgi:hypothetical protein